MTIKDLKIDSFEAVEKMFHHLINGKMEITDFRTMRNQLHNAEILERIGESDPSAVVIPPERPPEPIEPFEETILAAIKEKGEYATEQEIAKLWPHSAISLQLKLAEMRDDDIIKKWNDGTYSIMHPNNEDETMEKSPEQENPSSPDEDETVVDPGNEIENVEELKPGDVGPDAIEASPECKVYEKRPPLKHPKVRAGTNMDKILQIFHNHPSDEATKKMNRQQFVKAWTEHSSSVGTLDVTLTKMCKKEIFIRRGGDYMLYENPDEVDPAAVEAIEKNIIKLMSSTKMAMSRTFLSIKLDNPDEMLLIKALNNLKRQNKISELEHSGSYNLKQ